MNKISVMLDDNEVLFRAGLHCLIDRMEDFEVISEVSTQLEAVLELEQGLSDILIISINGEIQNGFSFIRGLKQQFSTLSIIVFAMENVENLVAEAFQAGVSAILLKASTPEELVLALHAVALKSVYLSPAISTNVIKHIPLPSLPVSNPLQLLTSRQLEVLTMIGWRKSIKQIAHELNLSPKTVAAHRTNIMERVGEKDTVGLVFLAQKCGLIKITSPL